MDESVCHLQDGSFQISLGREGAVPVWLGMGWLETKSREVPQSEQYQQHCLGRKIDLELVDFRWSRTVPSYSTPGPETVRARTESSRITHSLHLDPICVTTI